MTYRDATHLKITAGMWSMKQCDQREIETEKIQNERGVSRGGNFLKKDF